MPLAPPKEQESASLLPKVSTAQRIRSSRRGAGETLGKRGRIGGGGRGGEQLCHAGDSGTSC